MFAPRTPDYYSSFRPSPAGPSPWPDDKQHDVVVIPLDENAAAAGPDEDKNKQPSQHDDRRNLRRSSSFLHASSTAQTEADRRRGLEETYTTPITTTSVKNLTKVTDFMSDFNKFSETYESTFLNHLQEYKGDLRPIYRRLVPAELTHKAFVQHYFFRCGDLQRIQDELDEEEKARVREREAKKQEEEERRKKKQEEEEQRIREELEKQQQSQHQETKNGFSLSMHSNSSTIRWRGVSNDDPTKRAAWETSEGARISLKATNPPKHVERQDTMEYNWDAAKAADLAAEADGGNRSWTNDSTEYDKSKQEQAQFPLYSRLRFPFRRNQHAQSAVKSVLKYTHTDEGEGLIGVKDKSFEKGKTSLKMSRSMSPVRPTWEDSGSSHNIKMVQPMTKPERQISNLSDSVYSGETEEPKGLFASIRSQWEENTTKTSDNNQSSSFGKPSMSKLDDSQNDLQLEKHMTLPISPTQKLLTQTSSASNAAEYDNSFSKDPTFVPEALASSQKRPNKNPPALSQRSNSAKDLIKHMEAVNQERRDRTLGPPVTTVTRGRMPRRHSESSNASAPAGTTRGRGSMQNFRSSSFAYRGRGASPANNDLQQSSFHSQPGAVRTNFRATSTASSDASYTGSVRSRVEAWRLRGSSVGASSRRTLMSEHQQTSQSFFANESLQPEAGSLQPKPQQKHQRMPSTSSITSSLHMSEASVGPNPGQVPTNSPIPQSITTSSSFRISNHGASSESTRYGFIISTDDPLALKSVVRANRRRNLAETYTQPLELLIQEDPSVQEYIENFDLMEWTDDAILALAKYQDTLAMQHEQFVISGEISERDFWCRYFYKCDEKRILEDMRRKQSLGILGQSSRNLFANPNMPLNNTGASGGKAFARGPRLQQQKVVSGPAGFGSSFRRNEMNKGGGSEGDSSFQSSATRRYSLSAAAPARTSSLKEKLRDWNKVTAIPGAVDVSGRSAEKFADIPSAAARAQRYRNRTTTKPNPPASFRKI
jgi:hypothetical protein